jgi:hypothetical protein
MDREYSLPQKTADGENESGVNAFDNLSPSVSGPLKFHLYRLGEHSSQNACRSK